MVLHRVCAFVRTICVVNNFIEADDNFENSKSMKYKFLLSLMLNLLVVALLQAQQVSVPYLMGFEEEDSTELKNWVLNPGAKASLCEDQWTVGEATAYAGKQSLYISNNNGQDPTFGASPNIQYVYRDFILPAGVYVLSFDWKCVGASESSLYAGILPIRSAASAPVMEGESKNSGLADVLKLRNSMMTQCYDMKHSSRWKHVVITGQSDNAQFFSSTGSNTIRLFFIWMNNNTDTTLQANLGACIDNVQITSAECMMPTNLTANVISCDEVNIAWNGVSEKYRLEYRKTGNEKWVNRTITDNASSIVLQGMDEGMYDLRICGLCNDTIQSAYCYLNNFVIFCPEKHCLNYVDLEDTNIVTCYYGTFDYPYLYKGVIDNGSANILSRHTVNWDLDARDPLTGNQLPLVPPGELASIRLGNEDINAQAEGISYKYHVDTMDAAILLMKYAIVMQDPAHTKNEQPRFVLEILNEYGELIDPTCGKAYFTADAKSMVEEGWHSSSDVIPYLWKDWTTIGLDLRAYEGQDVIIRLTTHDCAQGGHFGYAYFTLGCAAARIYSNSCGDEPEIKINAPLGFTYQWYDVNGNPVPDERGGRSESLQLLPSDTTTYTCRLTSTENTECFFELSTASKPRYPIAEFKVNYTPTDCKNVVSFQNLSHIYTHYSEKGEHHYDQECEEYEWLFSTGERLEEKNPTLTFPAQGGQFTATLTAYIADKGCSNDTTIVFTLPALADTTVSVEHTICQGEVVTVGDAQSDSTYIVAQSGVYQATWKTNAGCDSTLVYNVKVMPRSPETVIDTTICAGETLSIDGDIYPHTKSGTWPLYRKNQFGCDSIVKVNVNILDSILPIISMTDIQGDKEYSGELHLGGTGYTSFQLNGTRYNADNKDILGLNGGELQLVFFNDFGCYIDTTLYMSYPCRNLIFQRWNDVLSVYNHESLAVYSPNVANEEFTSFQWMKNEVDIPGAVLSYYYEPDGLDENSVYQVRVVTASGEILISCPFYPTEYKPKQNPVSQKILDNNALYIVVDGVLFNSQGIRTNSVQIK